jgi:site-specific DNA-methyltransferase (adenine-specific)
MASLIRRPRPSRRLASKLITKHGLLIQGDALSLFELLKPNSVDCIFADPPFNLGKSYGTARITDRLSEQRYVEWTHRWLLEAVRVLKPGGSLFVYHIPKRLAMITSYLESVPGMGFQAWIAIKMKNSFPVRGRLHPAHYGLLYFSKSGATRRFHVIRTPSPVCRHCGQLLRDYGGYHKKYRKNHEHIPMIQLSDVWDDISPNIHRKRRPKAINELPLSIPERAIRLSTNKGALVLDPFAGGGGALGVSESIGRFWIGAELGSTSVASGRILEAPAASARSRVPKQVRRAFYVDEAAARGLFV